MEELKDFVHKIGITGNVTIITCDVPGVVVVLSIDSCGETGGCHQLDGDHADGFRSD